MEVDHGIGRRRFLKYGAIATLAAAGAASGLLAYPVGLQRFAQYGKKPWETEIGVVDYSLVPDYSGRVTGRPNTFDPEEFPANKKTLIIAQWYDYWPGIVVSDFGRWMREKRRIDGITVEWTSNIYTANEELFTWVTQTGRKFDIMFPTNYTVETLEKAGQLVNLNLDWIPNYTSIFGKYVSNPNVPSVWEFDVGQNQRVAVNYEDLAANLFGGYNNPGRVDFRDPFLNGYAYRSNTDTYPSPRGTDSGVTWDPVTNPGLLAVPYQWGTTGIGYRTDIFRPQDIETYGWSVFELETYTNPEYRDPETGQVGPQTFDLTGKRMMLDDMREVFTAALKQVGWKRQEADGLTPRPTPIHDPDVQAYVSGEQWSANETYDDYLRPASDWLLSWINDSWGFNTPQQGPWLSNKQMYVDQAWSGDIIYAIRPYSYVAPPVDYFVPKQGGARWIDTAVIHRESENLWLSHQFIDYILEEHPLWGVGSAITSWNSYATPNGPSFFVLHANPKFTSPNGWNQTTDRRIYADIAVVPVTNWNDLGDPVNWGPQSGPLILNRTEYQKDVGVRNTLKYFNYWRSVKF
jgi:spermidine/putrescine transport system substrate-binding protein